MAEEKAAPKAGAKKDVATKRPSALKRDEQNEKRRQRNKSYRSLLQTAVRSLKNSLSKKENIDAAKEQLQKIYSILDKGCKRGILKQRAAARKKSRLSAFCKTR